MVKTVESGVVYVDGPLCHDANPVVLRDASASFPGPNVSPPVTLVGRNLKARFGDFWSCLLRDDDELMNDAQRYEIQLGRPLSPKAQT